MGAAMRSTIGLVLALLCITSTASANRVKQIWRGPDSKTRNVDPASNGMTKVVQESWQRADGTRIRQVVFHGSETRRSRKTNAPVVVTKKPNGFFRNLNLPDGSHEHASFMLTGAKKGAGIISKKWEEGAKGEENWYVHESFAARRGLAKRSVEYVNDATGMRVMVDHEPGGSKTKLNVTRGSATPEQMRTVVPRARAIAQTKLEVQEQ
jgi:hypothetical protein